LLENENSETREKQLIEMNNDINNAEIELTNMLKELDNNLNESKNLNDDTSKNKKHYVTIKKSTKLSLFSALF
jgi:hypothetical protein